MNKNSLIYLDNSATTQPSQLAISRMLQFYTEHWGTPSAPHQMGQELYPAMEESLRSIYALLNGNEAADLVYTSSGAEAVNQAIFSTYQEVTRLTGKNQFITSHIDEAPAIMSIGRLEQMGCIGRLVNPDFQGKITAENIAESVTPRTAMVSLSWANGMTGVINPVEEIGLLCKDRGIRFHLDATHVLGKLFFDLEAIHADFLTFNGDNLHAPKGTGALYIKEGISCAPFIVGGIEQHGKRAGSINVAGLVAIGQAAKEALDNRDYLCTEIARLRNKFEEGILKEIPESHVFFQDQERLPHCSAIAFPGVANEALLYALNRKGVLASMGGGSFQQIGLILKACGIPEMLANSALSFSLSRTTTENEIDRAVEIIGETFKKLRKTSQQLIL